MSDGHAIVFWLRYGTPSGSGKYMRFELRMETGAERTTSVDIFDIIQQVRDTDIHLKGYSYSIDRPRAEKQ